MRDQFFIMVNGQARHDVTMKHVTETLVRVSGTFYYEISIKSAGIYNDIELGVVCSGKNPQCKYVYHLGTGHITCNGERYALGPQAGSWDIVGVAISTTNELLFTFHGIPIRPGIPLGTNTFSLMLRHRGILVMIQEVPVDKYRMNPEILHKLDSEESAVDSDKLHRQFAGVI